MKGAFVFWLLTLLVSPGLQAQTSTVEGMRAKVRVHSEADTARTNCLNALAMELRSNAPDESAKFFREALRLAQQLGYTAGVAEAQLGLGFYHRHRSEFGLAQMYSEQARAGFARVGDRLGQTRSLYNLSCVFSKQGMHARSLAANLQGLALAEAAHDRKWLAFLNTQLGITSTYLGEYASARQHLTQGLQWARLAADPIGIGHAYSGLGDLYRLQGQWGQAQRNYEQDAAIFQELKNEVGTLFEEINIGDMLERQGRYPEAFSYGFRNLKRAQQMRAVGELPRVQLLLARAFLHTARPDSALRYGQLSLRATQRSGAREYGRDASALLAQASARLGRYADAYRYEQLFGSYKDSLNSSDLQRRAAVLQYRAELDKKQAQIGLLTKNSQLIRAQNRQQQWVLAGALLGLAVVGGLSVVLWRSNSEKKRAYALLKQQQNELKAAQGQLVQAEKWAFVGELSAGIAHELQNPLNFMKNFAEVSVAMLDEDHTASSKLEQEILAGLKQNLQKISQHGQRASSIINDMLEHSRNGTGLLVPTNINALATEALTLAYQGLETNEEAFDPALNQELDPNLGPISAVAQDLSRVLLNLSTNALYAVRERQQQSADSTCAAPGYVPTVTVSTRRVGEQVEIRVRDNGLGIPEAVRSKIFQPFFTTKPAGEGTGLGLSLSYDIVTKGHGGTLTVESQEGVGTDFLICLPA